MAQLLRPTRIRKNFRKEWKAESEFKLDNGMELGIMTFKTGSGELVTYAQAEWNNNGMTSFIIYQDFRKMICNHGKVRVTQKSIEDAHMRAIATIDSTIDMANKFYEGKVVAA